MVRTPLLPDALTLFPAMASVQPPLGTLGSASVPMTVDTGTLLFQADTPCQGFPLVLDGEVRVSRVSSDGRSLELYRVVPGELCLVSSASLFSGHMLAAQGVATRPTTLLLIPPAVFQQWLEHTPFRNSVMGLFAERMADLTSLIDAVAFHKLDHRLAGALLGRGQQLSITHQALADELGTVREIVTRLLRRFEREGWVTLGREQIQIVNSAALRALARHLPD